MALAGDLTQPTATSNHAATTGHRFLARQTITRIANRAIRISHRMIGFGVPAADSETDPGGLETYCRPAPHDASAYAEMATELRLRQIVRQATAHATRATRP